MTDNPPSSASSPHEPAGDQSAQSQPAEGQSAEGKPAKGGPAESQSAESRSAASRSAEGQSAGGEPAGGRPVEPRSAEGKPLLRVGSADSVLAVIPGLLGFHPADSIVVVGAGPPRGRIQVAFR